MCFSALGCNGTNGANGGYEAAAPGAGAARTVTVTVGGPGDLWIDDLPLIAIRRGRSEGHLGYEVWFEVNGARQVQFWRRTAIDLGEGAPDHAQKWGTFSGERVHYPGALTAESAPRIHEAIMWIEAHYQGEAEGGISAMEAFGAVAVAGSFVPVGSATAGTPTVGSGAAARALPSAPGGVWKLGWAERGRRIEAALGGNLPRSFPVVDKFNRTTGVATSIKSIDLTSTSYQNAARVYSRVKGFVDKLAGFRGMSWAKVRIDASEIQRRVLELVVPSAGTVAQQQAIQRAVEYARSLGVDLKVIVFP